MSDKPIIFSAPMIRALLEGRKTQTRRVLNWQPEELRPWGRLIEPWFDPAGPPFRVEHWRIIYPIGLTIRRPSRHGRRTGFGRWSVAIDPWLQWAIIQVVAAAWLLLR